MRLKRWLTGLAITIAATQPATATFAAWPDQFSDVDTWPAWAIAGEWKTVSGYKGYSVWGGEMAEVVWWELMVGSPAPDGQMWTKRAFRPNDSITRAEYATILVRAMDLPTQSKPGLPWYRPYVDALKERGIIDHDGDFMQPILRGEMGEWVGRSLKWYGVTAPSGTDFPDTAKLPGAPFIRIATGLGVIRGYPDGTYGPGRTASRAEGGVMAVRLVKQLQKSPVTATELVQFYRDMYAANTKLEKMAHVPEPYDRRIIAPYLSDLYLDGDHGVHYDLWWEKIGSTPGWRVLDNIQVETLLARDTVVLVKSTVTLKYVSEKQKLWGEWALPQVRTRYEFLSKRNGKWILSETETFSTVPERYVPKPEKSSP